jgi:hypothetical protein
MRWWEEAPPEIDERDGLRHDAPRRLRRSQHSKVGKESPKEVYGAGIAAGNITHSEGCVLRGHQGMYPGRRYLCFPLVG